MNGAGAGRVVVASVVVIVGTTIVRHVRAGTWRGNVVQVIIFGYLLAIALLILAIVVPVLAKILAYLGLVGAFAVNGPSVFAYLGDMGRNERPAGAKLPKGRTS
jgi:hypothetical protein